MAQLDCGGTRVLLEKECILGRHRSCGMVVRDAKASRQHARVFLLEGDWWVEDLKSANGTRLNGEKLVKPTRLSPADVISIGTTQIRLLPGDAPPAPSGGPRIPAHMVGRTIAGYRIDGEIGKGVTGTIYTATQLALERGVAFKILDPAIGAGDAGFAERFIKTITKAASLTHDGLVKIHECGQYEGLLWYTMELVHGDTLASLLKRDGSMEPTLALMIAEKVADALEAAHEVGLAHGDVKPATIMLTESGHVKVLDIGVVGLTPRETRAAQAVASTQQVFYLAPEQSQGGQANVAGDVYSLGCVIVHALTGQPPYTGEDFATVATAHTSQPLPQVAKRLKLPEKVDTVISQMMAKNPEWRYESMREVKAALHALREAITPDAASQEAEERARATIGQRARRSAEAGARQRRRERERGRQLVVLVALVLAVAIAALIAYPHLGAHAPVEGSDSTAATTADAGTATGGSPSPTPTAGPAGGTAGAATGPAPVDAALVQAWQDTAARVAASVQANDWGAAELALNTLRAHLPATPAGEAMAARVRARASQLEIEGDQWFQAQVKALPAANEAQGLQRRLHALSSLRDVALTANRPDAEARYQQALDELNQRLLDARRSARVAVEEGRFQNLVGLADGLAPVLAGTPLAPLQQTFAAQAHEAARATALWKGDWPTTRAQIGQLHGPGTINAAALVLIADDAEAVPLARRLLGDPSLTTPDLLRRKAALLGQAAAVLAFRDPADLQFIDSGGSDVRLGQGALRADDPGGVLCTVPLAGGTWSAEVVLDAALTADAEAVVAIVHGDQPIAVVRIGATAIHCRVHTASGDTPETPYPRPPGTGAMHVRITDHDGTVQLRWGETTLLSVPGVSAPTGSQLRVDVGAAHWALTRMVVLGEE